MSVLSDVGISIILNSRPTAFGSNTHSLLTYSSIKTYQNGALYRTYIGISIILNSVDLQHLVPTPIAYKPTELLKSIKFIGVFEFFMEIRTNNIFKIRY